MSSNQATANIQHQPFQAAGSSKSAGDKQGAGVSLAAHHQSRQAMAATFGKAKTGAAASGHGATPNQRRHQNVVNQGAGGGSVHGLADGRKSQNYDDSSRMNLSSVRGPEDYHLDEDRTFDEKLKRNNMHAMRAQGVTGVVAGGDGIAEHDGEHHIDFSRLESAKSGYNAAARHPQRHAHMDASEMQALEFAMLDRSRMSQGQQKTGGPGARQKTSSVVSDDQASRVASDKQQAPPSRLLFSQSGHGSPHQAHHVMVDGQHAYSNFKQSDQQMQLHQMMTASLGTTAVHNVLHTPAGTSANASLTAHQGVGHKRAQANGRDRGSLPPPVTGKSRTKKKKQHSVLQDALQSTSGYHQIMQHASASPNKKRSQGKPGAGAPLAGHYASMSSAPNSGQMVLQYNATTPQQSMNVQQPPQNMGTTGVIQGAGQGGINGAHGRRRLLQEPSNVSANKISQQRLNPAGGLQSMTVIHSKRASASNQPSHSTKRAVPPNVPLPTNSQTLVYFNQIREAAERGISVGPTAHPPHNPSHGKSGHKRRNERVAIDTFNITGERGNPLFKQDQPNSNITSAQRSNDEVSAVVHSEKKDLAKIIENESVQAPSSINKGGSNSFNQTAGPTHSATTNLLPQGSSSQGPSFPSAAQTVGPSNHTTAAALFLPDISTNRKSGMSHGQFKNASAGNPTKQYVHRGSNSFSGMTAEGAEAAANANLMRDSNSTSAVKQVFSEHGDSHNMNIKNMNAGIISGSFHSRTQQSVDMKMQNSLQQTPQLRAGRIDQNVYQNVAQAVNANERVNMQSVEINSSYPGGGSNQNTATPIGGPVQTAAISEDLRRRTTGSLFQTPLSNNHQALTKTMQQNSRSNNSRPNIISDKNDLREPSDVLSLSTGQAVQVQPPVHLSKHVKNIVQPIHNEGEACYADSIEVQQTILEANQIPVTMSPHKKINNYNQRVMAEGKDSAAARSLSDPPSGSQPDRSAQGGNTGAAVEGQSISRDNSVFMDSVMQRMNPRQGQKRTVDILASSKKPQKSVRQRKDGTSVRRDTKKTPKTSQHIDSCLATPKPTSNGMGLAHMLKAQVAQQQQQDEQTMGGTTPAGDILSGLNSLLSSQPRPFEKVKDSQDAAEESKDDIETRQPLDVNFGADSDANHLNQNVDFDEEEEDEDEDEPDEDEELLESVGDNYHPDIAGGGAQTSYRNFGLNLHQPYEAPASGPPTRYKKHTDAGQILPTQFNNMASADYYQSVSQQVGSSGPAGAGAQPKARKKAKRHRRLNTHHHYHIDLNFEQVNNILVSYGGVGHQQTFKNNIRKDASKANVSMSVGGVGGQGQHAGFQRGPNQPQFSANTTAGPAPGPNVQQRQQFHSGPAGSPSKRQQVPPPPGTHPNPLQLPELIINKNKINFGAKQFKMQTEAAPASPQDVGQPGALRTSGKPKVEATSFVNYAASRATANQQRSKRQRTQQVPATSHKKKDSVLSATQIIDESISNAFNSTKKEKSVSQKVGLAQKMNPQGHPGTGQPSVQQETPQTRYPTRPDMSASKGHAIVDSDAAKSRVSQGSHHEKPVVTTAPVSQIAQNAPMQTRVESPSKLRGDPSRGRGTQWYSAQRQLEQNEAKKLIERVDDKNATHQNFGLRQAPDSRQGISKAPMPQKPTVPGAPAGASQSRFRAKAPLHVLTLAKNNPGNSGGAIETPKRHFNVKGGPHKNKAVRMTVMEHHSAGLRPPHKGGVDADGDASHVATPAAGHHGVGAGKNFNTLSQISSVVSNSEQSIAPNPAPRTATAKGGPGSAFKAPKGAKQMMKDQAMKLRAIDERYERTNQMIEHLSNLNQRGEVDDESGAGSPLRAPTRVKKTKPKITDFKIEGIVGVGNFGKVHKAINLREDRVVALKTLLKEGVAEMKHVDHVINEREVLQYLSEVNQLPFEEETKGLGSISRVHENSSDEEDNRPQVECPFIMSIYSSFQDKENLYFELEYVEGCTLLSQIRAYNQKVMTNMPWYAAEVLMTLEYLHNNCVIYRDLKPENTVISMQERGHLKLVDFGFAKRLQNIKQKTHTNCGTPAYIAPEVLRDANGHGYEADIWSLGVLMVEIVSGQTPFQGESTQEVYENVNKCQPQYNKLITSTMRDLLNKIFVGDPDTRIGLAQIKKHAVFDEYDFSVSMRDRHASMGPFIPTEAAFNERADRDSEQMQEVKPKNLLAALMGVPTGNDQGPPRRLSFDEAHYDKFQRERRKADDGEETAGLRRKRHNPLGDFKFRRINELF